MIEFIIYIALVLIAGGSWYYRVEWVRQQRIRLIDDDFIKYRKLPTFSYMVSRFWVWDVDKFIGQDPE